MTGSETTLVVRSRRVVRSNGATQAAVPASIHINERTGRITGISDWDDAPSGVRVADFIDSVIMPGIVDTHVHVNEPGRTEWEGFASASRAALAGGVTTICDMPLNAIPATTSVAALEAKRAAARAAVRTAVSGRALERVSVDVRFIGGVVPGNAADLEPLRDAGVCAFKCFLSPSGVDEFTNVTESDLTEALPELARLGLPLMVHAEDPARLLPAGSGGSGSVAEGARRRYSTYLASRPVEAEHSAIRMLIRLMERWPTPVHIVHLSSATSLSLVDEARSRGLPLTVETCPHYLSFAAEEIPDGGTEFKCAPPIRVAEERDALWKALIDGSIDQVATDHSPCPPEMKGADGDFLTAWGGIASLQLTLPVIWTGALSRGLPPESLARWMCQAPARLVGLGARKGVIAAGYDADLVIWDPEASFVVDPTKLLHRHQITPYAGRRLFGMVRATAVGGRLASGGV